MKFPIDKCLCWEFIFLKGNIGTFVISQFKQKKRIGALQISDELNEPTIFSPQSSELFDSIWYRPESPISEMICLQKMLFLLFHSFHDNNKYLIV